jgi:amino acid permease
VKTKKFLFYFSFALQLIGLGGFFGKIIHDGIQNFQSSAVGGNMSKDAMIVLAILFVVGVVGFIASNKLVDQLNRIEDAKKAT